MPHLYLPAEHTDTDLALASAVAEAIDSNELFVAWTLDSGCVAAPEVRARVRRAEAPQRSAMAEAVRRDRRRLQGVLQLLLARHTSARGHAPAGAGVTFRARERLAHQRREPLGALDEDVRRRAAEAQPQVRAGRLGREARAGSRRRSRPRARRRRRAPRSSVPSGSRSHMCSPPVGTCHTAPAPKCSASAPRQRVAALAQPCAQRLEVAAPAR